MTTGGPGDHLVNFPSGVWGISMNFMTFNFTRVRQLAYLIAFKSASIDP